MSFDCAYRGIGVDESVRLTRDAIAASAREHGLTTVYVIAGVEVVPRRWRRRLVDVIVHMADGDDVLGMQFPDEARAAVTAAVESIVRAPQEITRAVAPRPVAPARPVVLQLRAMRKRQRGRVL